MNPTESKKPLNLEVLSNILKTDGISVRLNLITKETEITGLPKEYNQEDLANDLPILIYDKIKTSFTCNKDQICDLLKLIAGQNRYNPLDELMNGVRWDGQDRIQDLFEILGIENDSLSKTLLKKWLNMAWRLGHNSSQEPEGADGMLVLVGKQGCGKTSFVRKIGAERRLFKLGMYLDFRDKDLQRRATGAWITELAELEVTMRTDLERLKAFITSERDETRLPYARTDRKAARRTVFIGTCNSAQFLVDPTGSRRFWTIPVENIDLERLSYFDAKQLWAQVELLGRTENYPFRLTAVEQAALAKRNTHHERPLKSQLEIEDILGEATENHNIYEWNYMSVSDFKAEYTALAPYSVEQIGKALDRLGIPAERKTIDGRQIRARKLPQHKWAVERFKKYG